MVCGWTKDSGNPPGGRGINRAQQMKGNPSRLEPFGWDAIGICKSLNRGSYPGSFHLENKIGIPVFSFRKFGDELTIFMIHSQVKF